jgi:hypothetical protein
MSWRLIALLLVTGVSYADDEVTETSDDVETEIPDQSLGAAIGIAGGGRVTPGGLRVTGHYLYQLSEQDWFDGTASFTFGGSGSECFRDRMDYVICDHGFTDGRSVEAIAAVRRYFTAQGKYIPFARLGAGLSFARFGDDDVTGIALDIHAGGGVRAAVAKQVAVVGQAEVLAGIGRFSRGMGNEPQLGIAITAGAEFRLP